MKIKCTVKSHQIPVRMAVIRKQKVNVGENVEKKDDL